MKRRNFLASSAALGLGLGSTGLAKALSELIENPDTHSLLQNIHPYFLDSGIVSKNDEETIIHFARMHEDLAAGKPVSKLRGDRPKGTPTYRFMHWDGDIGDSTGKFVGPLSLKPFVDRAPAYQLNAQLLAFHPATDDWRHGLPGALTIEMRAPGSGDPLTWLFAEQFGVSPGGETSLGLGYVAQRQGVPNPLSTNAPNVEIRIQLMQHKDPGLLQKVLKLSSMVLGTGIGAIGQATTFGQPIVPGLLSTIPSLRIPGLAPEGVAFAQALLGSTAPEEPIWRSGFNAYGLGGDGGRMRLRPGFWVVMDEQRQTDLRGIKLGEYNGRAALLRDEAPLKDLNYLVLDVSLNASGNVLQPQPQYQPSPEFQSQPPPQPPPN
jgi:hypothetical protein